jgi:hypothetical protein
MGWQGMPSRALVSDWVGWCLLAVDLSAAARRCCESCPFPLGMPQCPGQPTDDHLLLLPPRRPCTASMTRCMHAARCSLTPDCWPSVSCRFGGIRVWHWDLQFQVPRERLLRPEERMHRGAVLESSVSCLSGTTAHLTCGAFSVSVSAQPTGSRIQITGALVVIQLQPL